MRTALVGAVESTRVALEVLIAVGHAPLAIVTLAPESAGRHSDYVDLSPYAARSGVDVIQSSNVNAPNVVSRLSALELDYLAIIGWSQIGGRELLSCAAQGTIGYHPAALPQNRGRAVIPWTIIQGLQTTGSTLFWIDEGVDSGDVLAQLTFPVAPDETASSLYQKHMDALTRMLADVSPMLAARTAPRYPQDHSQGTYCSRRTADDGWIDWSRPAHEVWTLVRASGDPYPGAFTIVGDARLVLWEADYVGTAPYSGTPGEVQAVLADGALVKCGDGEHVLIKVVQLGDGPRVHALEVLSNHTRLGMRPWDIFQMTHPMIQAE